jgi:hypothetical protein
VLSQSHQSQLLPSSLHQIDQRSACIQYFDVSILLVNIKLLDVAILKEIYLLVYNKGFGLGAVVL